MPDVVAVDTDDAAGGYLVMTECPGTPWPQLAPPPARVEAAGRAVLGGQVPLQAQDRRDRGYPSGSVGPLRETWRAAFLDMVNAVLADAETYAVTLPRPIADILEWFNDRAVALEEVTTPVLVHFDLWDGNILVESDPAGHRIGALIDAERAFWGDPLAEFVSLALYGDIERDTAFLAGYRGAGGAVTFDIAARQRLSLYRTYLNLIMWVEAVPRGFGQELLDRIHGRVYQPLADALSGQVAPDLPPGARTH